MSKGATEDRQKKEHDLDEKRIQCFPGDDQPMHLFPGFHGLQSLIPTRFVGSICASCLQEIVV
jgi:hypothetical protein